jgi:hypothetical protein
MCSSRVSSQAPHHYSSQPPDEPQAAVQQPADNEPVAGPVARAPRRTRRETTQALLDRLARQGVTPRRTREMAKAAPQGGQPASPVPESEAEASQSSEESIATSSSSEREAELADYNPTLISHLGRIGLDSAALVGLDIELQDDHPALQMAAAYLRDFFSDCCAPGFNTIRLVLDNQMDAMITTQARRLVDHAHAYAKVNLRSKRKESTEQEAGWMLGKMLCQIWAHSLRDLTAGCLRASGIQSESSSIAEDLTELFSESFATVAKALRREIDDPEMRQAFWRSVQAFIFTQITELDGVSDELEAAACDRFGVDLEEDYSTEDLESDAVEDSDESDQEERGRELNRPEKRRLESEQSEIESDDDAQRVKRLRER